MIFLLALLLASEPAASGQPGVAASSEPLIASCEAHKFETIVHLTVAGKPRSSRVKLCGKVGQTDAEWLRTLKDAIDKVAVNESMPAAAKDQVIAALNVEIAKLSPTATDIAPPPSTIVALPPATSLARPPVISSPVGGPIQYSTLPPLPAPNPTASAVAVAATAPPLPAPRMTFRCLAMDRLNAEGPCDLLERGTLLTVRADEDLPGGTSLRFLRRGDDRGEIDLPALRRGQSLRFNLPPRVCAGVSGSRVEIQTVRSARGTIQVVDTRGPFELRC